MIVRLIIRMLRRIFGPKVRRLEEKMHNEELHNFYSSPNSIRMTQSRRMRWVGHVVYMGEIINMYKTLVGKPEWKRPLGRRRHRWEDNIKMYIREIGFEDVDCLYLAQDKDQWREYGNEPSGYKKGGEFLE
jgi:hypothetical protein